MRPRTGLALLAALAGLASPAAAREMLLDGIAAQVGTDIVLVSEVMQMVGPNEARMRAEGAPEIEIAKLRADGLETMIEWRLIEKIVKDADLYASDEEVDQTIETIARENGISVAQLSKSVESQDMGFDEYKSQIKRELERRKVVNAMVAPRVQVEESEVRALYDKRFGNQPEGGSQLHLRQILVPASKELGRTLDQSCEIVVSVRERIEAGESFEELARQHSAAAPMQGGDIGWLHEDTLASWMIQAVAPLEPGGVSQVIELPFGCTLVKLVERRTYEKVSFEIAKPMLQGQVFEEKLADEYSSWMEELRGRTFIERRGYFADAARFSSRAREEELSSSP